MLDVVFVFPGQGAYSSGLFGRLCDSDAPSVRAMLRVSKDEFGFDLAVLAGDQRPIGELIHSNPDEAQLAIYIEAVHRGLLGLATGLVPTALIGHSFGEIAALTVAGCFSPDDGIRIVGRRLDALRLGDTTPGAMLAVLAEVERVDALIRVVASEGLTVAGINAPEQTIVSGPREQIDALAAIAKAARIPTAAIPSAHAFHNLALAEVARDFGAAIRSIPSMEASLLVYSPILHRAYRADDDLADVLASQLIEPFDFAAAIDTVTMHSQSGLLVECGAAKVLTTVLKRSGIRGGWTPLHSDPTLPSAIDWEALVRQQAGQQSLVRRIRSRGTDITGEDQITRFWDAVGPELETDLQLRFERWQASEDAAQIEARIAPAPDVPDVVASPVAAPSVIPAGSTLTPAVKPPLDGGDLVQQLAELYAEALEYPVEVFLDDLSVQLEADLGVDSVKQTDLLGRAAERFGLPMPETGFSVADYPTFASIVTLVSAQDSGAIGSQRSLTVQAASLVTATDPIQPPEAPLRVDATVPTFAPIGPAFDLPSPESGGDLVQQLAELYAEALEYPVEVFLDDLSVQLEADLGVDSVKQTDLLGRAAERFGLPMPETGFSVADYPTFASIVTLVQQHAEVSA